MSIASAIEQKQQQVVNAYTAILDKGGALPSTQNINNLFDAIRSIPTGSNLMPATFTSNGEYSPSTFGLDGFSAVTVRVQPTLMSKEILSNGRYEASADNVQGYSIVVVDVPYIQREISSTGVYQVPSSSFVYQIPSGVTDLSDFVLSYAFYGSLGITEANFSGLENINGEKALYMAFANCTNLVNIYFYDLTVNSFGTNTNQFNNMLLGVTGCTVHFPASIESTIDTWSDVVSGFGGTNTSILFDLGV